ncbi:arginase family protein [Caldovatus aquaticus]|uniref:Arginase family protein n=1 Tax=Caldovatus aquaticus TaxID=2865671 RepID=A0ABS7EZI7_9PROT|nr:arginase family protein [Caldovatus aquaticus]MBW8268770.1 arginase family protein [Caldovatus aquaticus]
MSDRAAVSLILVQGPVSDRTPGAMRGAAALARALAERHGLAVEAFGEPDAAPRDERWEAALRRARPLLEAVAARLARGLAAGERMVVVAGRCASSLATLPRFAAAHPGLGVVWFDAHGDFHTPQSTPTGYLGGMVLGAATGLWESGLGAGLDPRRLVMVGARDLDPTELPLIEAQGVRRVPPGPDLPARLRAALPGEGPLLVHVDWDVLDPAAFPAEYKVPGGLRPAELRACLAALAATGRVVGLEAAEFDAPDDPHATAIAAAIGAEVLRPVVERLLAP